MKNHKAPEIALSNLPELIAFSRRSIKKDHFKNV